MNLKQEVLSINVPASSVTLWQLGQFGFCVKSPGGKIIVIDPYLSNYCKEPAAKMGLDCDRLVPAPLIAADLKDFDIYAMTHSHEDHLDPETLAAYRKAGGKGPYLAPCETVEKLWEMGVPREQTLMIWPNKSYTFGDMTVVGAFAIPTDGGDLNHIGYIIKIAQGPTVYLTGDTSYHEELAVAASKHKPDVLVTIINGAFNNMGPAEAARLAKALDVKVAIPAHYDMFPSNTISPVIFETNLKNHGIGERYQPLAHGGSFTFSL